MDKFYSINELATITGLTTRTLRNYIKMDILNGTKKKPKKYPASFVTISIKTIWETISNFLLKETVTMSELS